ncbi:MAG: ABC transporter substrate-binding protein [Anaerolineales bacterium]|nr:ABC transporter substrate-binding protein [Anaerolineales bacterium]
MPVISKYKIEKLLLMLLLLMAGCSQFPGSTQPVVRIGLVAPFEGRHREIGYDLIYSARLAVREWNAAGGVENYRIELVAMDDGGDPEMAVLAAQSLAVDPDVVCVMGHWLPETTAAARPVYEQAGLLFIATDQFGHGSSTPPQDFSDRYREVTPTGIEPGNYAYPAYKVFNELVEEIGLTIRNYGRPTREGVLKAVSD